MLSFVSFAFRKAVNVRSSMGLLCFHRNVGSGYVPRSFVSSLRASSSDWREHRKHCASPSHTTHRRNPSRFACISLRCTEIFYGHLLRLRFARAGGILFKYDRIRGRSVDGLQRPGRASKPSSPSKQQASCLDVLYRHLHCFEMHLIG